MKKIITVLIIAIVILMVPASLKFSSTMFNFYSLKLARTLEKKQLVPGIKILQLKFARAKIASPRIWIWRDITSRIKIAKANSLLSQETFTIHVKQLKLVIADLSNNMYFLTADGITAVSSQGSPVGGKEFIKQPKQLKKGRLQLSLNLNIFSPNTLDQQVRDLLNKISAVLYTGKTIMPFNFSGIFSFPIQGKPMMAMVTTRRDDQGYYSLVVNQEFFKTSAWFMDETLTDSEAQLLSANPFKLQRLLEIMTLAKKESKELIHIQAIPEDAYRHVLWSFLLTREFGPEFAKKVTDAHENGDNTNTEAEHKMDFNNNAIGREYAQQGYRKDKILAILLNDPKVIRQAE